MFLLFFASLLINAKSAFASLIIVNSTLSDEQLVNWESSIKSFCSNKPDYENCVYLKYYSQVIVSNGQNINNELAQVSEKADYLSIVGDTISSKIDFNNLKKQMVVTLYQKKLKFEQETDTSLSKNLYSKTSNIKEEINPDAVQIVGNIKEKVSFLTIARFDIQVVDYDLEVNCFQMVSPSRIDSNKFKIKTEYFYYTGTSTDNFEDCIQTVEFDYCLNDLRSVTSSSYSYNYGVNNFSLSLYTYGMFVALPDPKIPYSIMERSGLVILADEFFIRLVSTPAVVKDINITVARQIDVHCPFLDPETGTELSEKMNVTIKAEGWENQETRPKVNINYKEKEVNLNIEDVKKYFDYTLYLIPSTSKPEETETALSPDEQSSSQIQNSILTENSEEPDINTKSTDDIITPITKPTQDDNDSTADNINSVSNSFELTTNGFISKENEQEEKETLINKNSETIKTVTFSKREIIITENGGFSSLKALYFVASNEDSEIIIDKSVKTSNIGVASTNSPTVKLLKSDNPLSFMSNNSEKSGIVKIDVLPDDDAEKITQLNMNDVDVYNGDFMISVSSMIEIITFKTLSMFNISAFSIQQNLKRMVKDSNSISMKFENINIDSNSETNIENADISGTLSIYDDSIFMVKENLNFSENSKIHLFIKNSISYVIGEKAPIISLQGELKTMPQSLTLSKINELGNINISNLPIIGAKSFENCEEWNDIIKLEEENCEISTVCKEKDGSYFLLLNAKSKIQNKGGNGLGTGAIIGIVVAAIVVVGVIIGVTIFLVKKKKKVGAFSSSEA